MASTAAETLELNKDAFMRLVTEEHLQVEGPLNGWLYTGRKGKDGWELFKAYEIDWDSVIESVANTADPAPGAQPGLFTCPTGKRWKILSLTERMVTDATAANRYAVFWATTVGGAHFAMSTTALPITASLTEDVAFSKGATAGGVTVNNGVITAGLPDIVLNPTDTCQIEWIGLQAGDNGGIVYLRYKQVDVP